VIASTRLDARVWLARGFRVDLYTRLTGHHVVIPPLRDRREDIGSIAAVLFRRIAPDRTELRVHRLAAFALMTYAYPLNVRELENALRDAVGLASEDEIRVEHLPPAIREAVRARQS
jgi:two-component system, NtrC family, response regulator PilR